MSRTQWIIYISRTLCGKDQQHTVARCNTLQHTAAHCNNKRRRNVSSTCVAVCCSVLQCVAVCCSVLQCVAVCCSVLQCQHHLTWHDIARHNSFKRVPWLVQMCDMPRSNVCHDSFKCVTCLVETCAMPRSNVCHDSFKCVTCLVETCAMTRSNVWHASFRRVPWLVQMCDMPRSDVCHGLFKCVTCLVQMSAMTHSKTWWTHSHVWRVVYTWVIEWVVFRWPICRSHLQCDTPRVPDAVTCRIYMSQVPYEWVMSHRSETQCHYVWGRVPVAQRLTNPHQHSCRQRSRYHHSQHLSSTRYITNSKSHDSCISAFLILYTLRYTLQHTATHCNTLQHTATQLI